MERLPDAAVGVLTAAFDLGEPVGPAVLADRGERGLVWRLTTSRGRWAIKQSASPPVEARALADVQFQGAVAGRVRAPAAVRSMDGRVLMAASALPDVGVTGSFRVHEWLDLDPDGPVTTEELARTVAALHAADLPAGPEPEPWFGRGVPAAQWDALVAAGRAAGEPWADDLAAAVPEFWAMAQWTTPDDPTMLRMCHRDLSARNVRRTLAGEVVVLDWENCGPADPARELAILLVVHAMVTDPGQVPLLYGAYCRSGGPARIRELADFSAAARGQAELVRLYAGQALDAHLLAADRQFARERMAWLLPPRVTVREVARLIEGLVDPTVHP